METSDIIQLGMMLVTAVALFVTISNFRKQLQLNFFADYTRRYQEIILNFPESINKDSFDIDSLPSDVRDKTLRYMRAYFDLCSEEYYLKRKNNIDNDTWDEWKTGMQFAFSKSAFIQAWKILRLDSIYYGEFTKFVNDSIINENIG